MSSETKILQMLALFRFIFRCTYFLSVTILTCIAASESLTSLYARRLEEYNGKKILQSEIHTFTNLSKIECMSACSREKFCSSFHFYPGGPTCVTLRERFNNVPVTSLAVPGYQLFQTDKPLSTIGSECELDVDCKSLLNSYCHKGSCRCDVGHRADGHTCRNYTVACPSSLGYRWDAESDMCSRIETRVKASWAEAVNSCTMRQGLLVRPDTATKMDQLKVLMNKANFDNVWVGGRYDDVARKWQWLGQTAITSSLWSPGQPSGDGSCLELHLNNRLNDATCSLKGLYICEIPLN